MKRKTIYSYYAFGYNYRLLRALKEGDSVHGGSNSTLARIEGLFEKLEELDLQVTQMVAKDLEDLRDELFELPKDTKLSKEHAERAREALSAIDPTLDAELQLRDAYIITPKRYDIKKLLDRPQEVLGKQCYPKLTDRSKRDFALGCRCIAFSQPTAAAFHIIRATEEMLRELYRTRTQKKDRPSVLLWAPMVDALRMKKTRKVKAELLDQLDMIRRNYRNPTQHPELFYDIDSAQDLLSNCASALNMICTELPDARTEEPPF